MATCTLTQTNTTTVRLLEEIDFNREETFWGKNYNSSCQQAIDLPLPARVAKVRNELTESAKRDEHARQTHTLSLFDVLAQLQELTQCNFKTVEEFEKWYGHTQHRHELRASLLALVYGHHVDEDTFCLLEPLIKRHCSNSASSDKNNNSNNNNNNSSSSHFNLSAMVMEVMRLLPNTLCSKDELPFDQFLTHLFLIAALNEPLTVLQFMKMVQRLGSHGQTAVHSAFRLHSLQLCSTSTLVDDDDEDNEDDDDDDDVVVNNIKNNNCSSSSSGLSNESNFRNCVSNHSLVCFYIHLKETLQSTLCTTSSFTGYYYTTALDDLIVMDMLTHRALLSSHWVHVLNTQRHYLIEAPETEVRNIRVSGQRAVLCEWLFMFALCHPKVRLRMETYFLGMALLDRFSMLHPLKRNDLLLYGCASLLLASKYEEIYSISLRVMVESAAKQFTHSQLIEAEMCIAQTLQFRIATATISHLSTALLVNQDPPANLVQKNMLLYIIGSCTVHTFYAQYRQSLLASGALYITKKICQLPHVGSPTQEVKSVLPAIVSLLRLNGRAAGILHTKAPNNMSDNVACLSEIGSSSSSSSSSSSATAAAAARSAGVSKQLYEAFARDEFDRVSEKVTLMLDEITW